MRPRSKKWIGIIATAVTAAMIWQHGTLLSMQQKPGAAPRTQRKVLRVWVCEDWMGSMAWLEKQVDIFERAHPGTMVRLRRAQSAELLLPATVLPDMLLFAPGTLENPEELLLPIQGVTPVRHELEAAGCWRGKQWALPVAMGGYGLLVNAEGYPDETTTAINPEAMAAAARPQRGKQPARFALQCALGQTLAYPAALLAQGGALQGGWPQGIAAQRGSEVLPGDFALCTPDKAYADFTGRTAMALLCTQRDIRRFSGLCDGGKGFPFRVEAPLQAFTDQMLFAAALRPADGNTAPLCAELLMHLTAEQAQQGLVDYGLFPVRADVPGYSADSAPWLHALAASLAAPDVLVPNAFSWATGRQAFLARAELALHQGNGDLTVGAI